MAGPNAGGDFVVDIDPTAAAPPAPSITRAGRAEQTDIGTEPQHTSEVRFRGSAATGTSSRPDAASDETFLEPTQTSTASMTSKGGAFAVNQFLASIADTLLILLKDFTPDFFFRPSDEELKLFNETQGYDRLRYPKVGDFPKGYPQLAAYINSDDAFLVHRKFGRIANRVLIHRQVQLTELEAELDKLDKNDAADELMRRRLAGYEGFRGWNKRQQELVSEIETNWLNYANVVLKLSEMGALGKAPERNFLSVYNWIWSEKPLRTESLTGYREAEDFISLAKHSDRDRWAKNLIESRLYTRPRSIFRYFLQTQKELDKSGDKFVDHLSPGRHAFLANLLDVSMATALLLAPVFLLFLYPMSRAWMCVTASVFLILSTASISTVTEAKPHEIFFGLAANAAVVFIFLGGLNQSGGGGSSA